MQLLRWHDNTARTPNGLTYTIQPLQRQDDGYILRLPSGTGILCDHPGYCKDEAERHYAANLVMPLDWQGDDLELCAETPLGEFHVYSGNGEYRAVVTLSSLNVRDRVCRTRDEAKAFCMSIFTSLVLSCLNVCRDEYP